jgi:hypothetical protein
VLNGFDAARPLHRLKHRGKSIPSATGAVGGLQARNVKVPRDHAPSPLFQPSSWRRLKIVKLAALSPVQD